MTRRRVSADAAVARAFLRESRRRLADEYLPRIRRAVQGLSPADVWWRPNPASNSIGNLLLHLEGNARQWILAGIAAAPDVRDRDAEFAARGGASGPALVARLARTLREADCVLARLRPADLGSRRTIQGYRVTILQAVYHVVEHVSGHTAQILYVAKLRRGRDLGLYPHLRTGVGARPARSVRPGRRVRPARRPRRFL